MGQDTLELFFQEGQQQQTMGDMVGVRECSRRRHLVECFRLFNSNPK